MDSEYTTTLSLFNATGKDPISLLADELPSDSDVDDETEHLIALELSHQGLNEKENEPPEIQQALPIVSVPSNTEENVDAATAEKLSPPLGNVGPPEDPQAEKVLFPSPTSASPNVPFVETLAVHNNDQLATSPPLPVNDDASSMKNLTESDAMTLLDQLRKDIIEQTQLYHERTFLVEQANLIISNEERSNTKRQTKLHQLTRNLNDLNAHYKKDARVYFEVENSRAKTFLTQQEELRKQWELWLMQLNLARGHMTQEVDHLHHDLSTKQQFLAQTKATQETVETELKALEAQLQFELERQKSIDQQLEQVQQALHLLSILPPLTKVQEEADEDGHADDDREKAKKDALRALVGNETKLPSNELAYAKYFFDPPKKRIKLVKDTLDQIHALDLSSQPDEGMTKVPYLIDAKHLIYADLHNNQIKEVESLKEWTELLWLDVSHCPLNSFCPQRRGIDLPLLVYLDLSNCELQEMPELPFPSLVYLHISHNQIKVLHIDYWLPLLHTLLMKGNRIDTIRPLEKCPNLSKLDIRHNCISDSFELLSLCTCTCLCSLDLSGNALDAASFPSIVTFFKCIPASIVKPCNQAYAWESLNMALSKHFSQNILPTTNEEVNLELQCYAPVNDIFNKLLPIQAHFESLVRAFHEPDSYSSPSLSSLLRSIALPDTSLHVFHRTRTQLVHARTHMAVLWFQARLRGILVRKRLAEKKKALRTLQSFFHRRYVHKGRCALLIQRLWRGYRTRKCIRLLYPPVSDSASLGSLSEIGSIDIPSDIDQLFDSSLLDKLEAIKETGNSILENEEPPTTPLEPPSDEAVAFLHPFPTSVGMSAGLELLQKQRTQLEAYSDWLMEPPKLPSPSVAQQASEHYEYNYTWDLSKGVRSSPPASVSPVSTVFPPLPHAPPPPMSPLALHKEAAMIKHLIQHGTPLKNYYGCIGSPHKRN